MYTSKIINYGYKKRVSVYAGEIETQKNTSSGIRKQYQSMTDKEKEISNQRRERYYKRVVHELIEIAAMNEFKTMVTLTFKENVTNYEVALKEWNLFLRRLRRKVDSELKYICVWEYQQQRGNVFHFHCLLNLKVEHAELERLWGNGFVWISAIKNKQDTLKEIKYMTKYLGKEIVSNQENSRRRMRFFFTSNNLNKPTVQKVQEKINLDNIIFENLEKIISDGSYYIKDQNNNVINRCDYVEFKI